MVECSERPVYREVGNSPVPGVGISDEFVRASEALEAIAVGCRRWMLVASLMMMPERTP